MAFAPFLIAAVLAVAPIDAARWHARVLVVFAPSADSAALTAQRAIDAREMNARDLRRVEVVGDRVSGASDSAAALRQRFGVETGEFRAVLLGKDGGVKLDERKPIDATRLFATIDAMPMRRDEAKRQKVSGTHDD